MERLVSIIVPIYNCEKYLGKCLNSLVNQSYKKIEIILVNDGSSDNSEKICKNYQKRDNRILYYYHKNSGPSFTRNIGIEKMNGDYYTFVDSDDILDLNFIKIMVNAIENNNSDFVNCNCIINNNSEIKYDFNIKKYNSSEFWKKFAVDEFSTAVWGKLYKTKLYKNIKFNNKIKNTEDKLYMFEILKKTNNYINIDYNGYYYFLNDNSLSKKFNKETIDNLLYVSEKINEYINKNLKEYSNIPISLTLMYILRNSIVFNKYEENKSIVKKELYQHKKDRINYYLIKNKKNRRDLRILKKCKLIYIIKYKLKLFVKRKFN